MEYYQHVATNGIANFQAKKLITEECLTLPTDLTIRRQRVDALAAHLTAANVLASQTLSLRRTRDLLLPRLLSGRINLEDVEPAA